MLTSFPKYIRKRTHALADARIIITVSVRCLRADVRNFCNTIGNRTLARKDDTASRIVEAQLRTSETNAPKEGGNMVIMDIARNYQLR
jgi:hypothetical protein